MENINYRYKINGQPTDYELPYHRTKKKDPVRISPSAKEESPCL